MLRPSPTATAAEFAFYIMAQEARVHLGNRPAGLLPGPDAAQVATAAARCLRTNRFTPDVAFGLWTRVLLSDEPLTADLVGAAAAAVYVKPEHGGDAKARRDLCTLVAGDQWPPLFGMPRERDQEGTLVRGLSERWGPDLVTCLVEPVRDQRSNLDTGRVRQVVRLLAGPLSTDALCLCAHAFMTLGEVEFMTATAERALDTNPRHEFARLMLIAGSQVLAVRADQDQAMGARR